MEFDFITAFAKEGIQPDVASGELIRARKTINYHFYDKLSDDQRQSLFQFLWVTLPEASERLPQYIKLSISNTIGHILLSLVPYCRDALMKSLQEVFLVSSTGFSLVLSSFCFLIKRFPIKERAKILEETPLYHHFKTDLTDHLPILINLVIDFPLEYQHSLVLYFLPLSMNSPGNVFILRAMAILVEQNPDIYSEILDMDMPLASLAVIFNNCMPHTSSVQSLLTKCIDTITNPTSTVVDFDSACILIKNLVQTQQATLECLDGLFQKVTITKSISSVLLLPIDFQIAKSLVDESRIKMDSPQICSLIKFFSKQQSHVEFFTEFVDKFISSQSEFYPVVLQAVSESPMIEELIPLVYRFLQTNSKNRIHRLWTLKIIAKLDYNKVPLRLVNQCFEYIIEMLTTKTEKVINEAIQTALAIFDRCPHQLFAHLISYAMQSIDIFDCDAYQPKLRFIAGILHQHRDTWLLMFRDFAFLLEELVQIGVDQISLGYIFIIMGAFVPFYEYSQRFFGFIRIAIDVICAVMHLYIGHTLMIQPTPTFKTEAHQSITLELIDADLLHNPNITTGDYLQTAKCCLEFLSRIKWKELMLTEEDHFFLFNLATNMTTVMPSEANVFVKSLLEMPLIADAAFLKFIRVSAHFSVDQESLLTLVSVLVAQKGSCDLQLEENLIGSIVEDVDSVIPYLHEIDSATINTLDSFLSSHGIVKPKEELERMVKSSEPCSLREREDLYSSNLDANSVCISQSNSLIPTLSPFLNTTKVPNAIIYSDALLNALFMFGQIKPSIENITVLIEFSLQNSSIKTLTNVLKIAVKFQLYVELEKYLSEDLFDDISILHLILLIFAFQYKNIASLSPLKKEYIGKFIKKSSIYYVIQSTTFQEHRIARALLKLDERNILNNLETLSKVKTNEALNLLKLFQRFKGNSQLSDFLSVQLSKSSLKAKKFCYLFRLFVLTSKEDSREQLAEIAGNILTNLEEIPASYVLEFLYDLRVLDGSLFERYLEKLNEFTPAWLTQGEGSLFPSTFLQYMCTNSNPEIWTSIGYFMENELLMTFSVKEAIYQFAKGVFKSKPSRDTVRTLFEFVQRNLDLRNGMYDEEIILRLYNDFIRYFNPKSQIFKDIVTYTQALVTKPIISVMAIELLTKISNKVKEPSILVDSLKTNLSRFGSYNSLFLMDAIREYSPSFIQEMLSKNHRFAIFYCCVKYGVKPEEINGMEGISDDFVKALEQIVNEDTRLTTVISMLAGESLTSADMQVIESLCNGFVCK